MGGDTDKTGLDMKRLRINSWEMKSENQGEVVWT